MLVHAGMIICMPMQFWVAAVSSSLGILTAKILTEMIDGRR
jgi:hypothetical protein